MSLRMRWRGERCISRMVWPHNRFLEEDEGRCGAISEPNNLRRFSLGGSMFEL